MRTIIIALLAGFLAQTVSAKVVYSAEFNTSDDMEGWTAVSHVFKMKQATAVGGGDEGVLTSANLMGTLHWLTSGTSRIALPEGENWSTLEIRFRQLDTNPPGCDPIIDNTGTRLVLTDDEYDLLIRDWKTKSYRGAAGRSCRRDKYEMTVIAQADNWQLVTIDFTKASYLKSRDFDKIMINPTTNADLNFEIDYVRLSSTAAEE